MIPERRLERASYRCVPWKNGGGTTLEIATGDGWRVSLATIERDGPFSDFRGYDRTIVAVEGNGCELRFDDGERVVLQALDPFTFAGERAVQCVLREGTVRDVNVMTRRTTHRHEISLQPLDTAKADVALLYLLDGPDAGDAILNPFPAGRAGIWVTVHAVGRRPPA